MAGQAPFCLGEEFGLLVGRDGAPVQEAAADGRDEGPVEAQPGVARAREAREDHAGDVFARLGVCGEFDFEPLRDAEVEGLEPDANVQRGDEAPSTRSSRRSASFSSGSAAKKGPAPPSPKPSK